jgi:hypothetical protein
MPMPLNIPLSLLMALAAEAHLAEGQDNNYLVAVVVAAAAAAAAAVLVSAVPCVN